MGKISTNTKITDITQKHPHGRGEDRHSFSCIWREEETPPRAWGRYTPLETPEKNCRNTPTGVGKISFAVYFKQCKRKHPHGRGEDLLGISGKQTGAETPPRAWGRCWRQKDSCATKGNTPTGVGKISMCIIKLPSNRKHPHGRGEDM